MSANRGQKDRRWAILKPLSSLAACLTAACATGGGMVTSKPGAYPEVCEAAQRHSLGCVPLARGAVIAVDYAEAKRIEPYALRGEARFQRFFGRQPASYVFISGTGVEAEQLLAGAAHPVKLMFPSAAQRADRSSVRRALEASLVSSTLATEQKEAVIQQGIKSAVLKSVAQEAAVDAVAVPHELGHLWFLEAYWPGRTSSSLEHYVSPAPDWLDEGAAQLMEGDGEEPLKRKKYMDILQGDGAIARGDLAALIMQEHPGQS